MDDGWMKTGECLCCLEHLSVIDSLQSRCFCFIPLCSSSSSGQADSQIPHLDDPEVSGLELNTTMMGVQFHFRVSFADLERLSGSERSFEQPKQINGGDPREFCFDISTNSRPTDVTRKTYYGMLFSLLPGEVVSNFGDS